MAAPPHLLDDEERREVIEVGFAASGRSGGADLPVHVEAGPEDWRVSHASGDLPGEAAGGRHATDLAARVDGVAVDGAVEMMRIDAALRDHLALDAAQPAFALLRIEIVQRIGAAFPLEPLG